MANEQVLSNAVSMLLNNGTDPSTGQIKTVSVSIGTLSNNVSAFDADKAIAISSAISNCLTKPLYRTQKTTKSYITAGA